MLDHNVQERFNLEEEGSLMNELLSDDIDRQRIAAAFVRASYDARARAREHGTKLVYMIDGKVQLLDPDSPLLLDLSPLVPIVKRLFPLPPEMEPKGF
jgi:hypothetical protein